MSFSDALWQSNLDLVRSSLEHPFVRGIATGTLARSRFAFYVAQDAFFLAGFARSYSIAAAKAPDWWGFEQFHQLAGEVSRELRLHEGYAAQWGVDLREITPAAATRRYTDFLTATAWSGDVGSIAVAMSPCMRLYAYLGRELANNGIPEHDYTEWIRTYSDPEFTDSVQTIDALVDRYATEEAIARRTYRYALECERDFFTAAWES